MRKSIVLSVATVFLLLAATSGISSSAQDTASDQTPTFYRLVPGTYVNGWPRFTLKYPKEWVERPAAFGGLFVASSPGPAPRDGCAVFVIYGPWPLDKYVDFMVPYYKKQASDVTLVSDKPSRLRDGTPARELEFKMVRNGEPVNTLLVPSLQGGILVSSNVSTQKGAMREDLRAIAYSIEFEPEKDKPKTVPPDVQEFMDRFSSDVLAHDLQKVMSHFSDRYLHSGIRKAGMEQFWRENLNLFTSNRPVITDFVADGDKVHYAGYVVTNVGILPTCSTLIKENGQWKNYGNQREVAPL